MQEGTDAAAAGPLPRSHDAVDCPECFTEVERDRDWWQARPAGSSLVGLVVTRDDLPSVTAQRAALARFGVPIEGFRHPAPAILESWETRIVRLIGTLRPGDVLVVVSVHVLGRDSSEEVRTVAALRSHGVIVKVLAHGGRHLADATVGAS